MGPGSFVTAAAASGPYLNIDKAITRWKQFKLVKKNIDA